jgi:hypothetical protein
MDQNRRSDVNPHIYSQLISTKEPKTHDG